MGKKSRKLKGKSKHPPAGWAEAAREMAANGDDELIDGDWPPTDFELNEWEWEISEEPPCEP